MSTVEAKRHSAIGDPDRLGDRDKGDGEEHHARAIVEQRLGVDDGRQATGRVQSLEQLDDGDRVRGRDDRAEQESERWIESGRHPCHDRDDTPP